MYNEDINLRFRTIRREKLTRSKQPKGLIRKHLNMFLEAQPGDPRGLRNRAMLSLGYELLTRRSELVALTTNDLKFLENGALRVLLRRSMADTLGQGRIAFNSRSTANAVANWLGQRRPGIDFLFCPVDQNKAVNRDLTTCTVKRLAKSSARAAGLVPGDIAAFSGHSMRVRAAQDLLCSGYGASAIMRAGGWKSIQILARYPEMAEHNVCA